MENTLETIIDKIIAHDREHPDHGIGCACHDQHAWVIRRLFSEKGIDTPETYKSRAALSAIEPKPRDLYSDWHLTHSHLSSPADKNLH